MKAPFGQILACLMLAVTVVGCSTMFPGPPVHVDGYANPSANDLREIGRLLPGLGIRVPITSSTMSDSDHATVYCKSEYRSDQVEFTVVRRAGHWVATTRPKKSDRITVEV